MYACVMLVFNIVLLSWVWVFFVVYFVLGVRYTDMLCLAKKCADCEDVFWF